MYLFPKILDLDENFSVSMGKLDCVAQQVEKHLLHPLLIGFHYVRVALVAVAFLKVLKHR